MALQRLGNFAAVREAELVVEHVGVGFFSFDLVSSSTLVFCSMISSSLSSPICTAFVGGARLDRSSFYHSSLLCPSIFVLCFWRKKIHSISKLFHS
ncbi:hypothetical protein RchiOBHm_Chr6g0268291 [Rosa chinensis]|uniref:Uncharacterized protein n=1 Tax=Rosa chinensis TaxID=74649 RepID=A0A2P6PQ51_ROSCH|nr:hypothetical protein RchiOBHm_Chr6g0268291 [Rosa chinensis]